MKIQQTREAIRFNKKQGYTADEIKLIQEITGSTPDGEWGPRTVAAIAMWQSENGLAMDGKVGHSTFKKIQLDSLSDEEMCPGYEEPKDITRPGKVVMGVWGDDPPRLMTKDHYIQQLQDLQFSEVALMMNRANVSTHADPWDLRWRDKGEEGYHDDEIGEISELYTSRGIKLTLTSWPRPSKSQIDEMCAAMVPLLKLTKANWEVDVEGNWLTKHLEGFASMKSAGEYLVKRMRETMVEAGVPDGVLEATTFGHHAELGRHPTVTPLVDRVCVQGYSTSPRASGKVIRWKSYLGPGRHQRWILSRARKAGAKKVVMGLAAYRQRGFTGHSAHEAMGVALDTTLSLGVHHVRYWSSKWILGVQADHNKYAAKFFEERVI